MMQKQIATLGLFLILKVPVIAAKSVIDGVKGAIGDTRDTFIWRMDRLGGAAMPFEIYKGAHIYKGECFRVYYYAWGNGARAGKTFYSLKSIHRYIDKVSQ